MDSASKDAPDNLERYESMFSSLDFVAVSIEAEEQYSIRTFERLSLLAKSIESLPTVSSVLSPATLADGLSDETDELRARIEKVEEFLSANETYRLLMSSESGMHWLLFALPEPNIDPELFAAEVVEAAVAAGVPRERVFGQSVLLYYLSTWIQQDFYRLLVAGVIIVFLLEWLICRRFLAALFLFSSSAVATIWTTALFGILGVPLTTETVVVPIAVLALSTSYGIHLFRFYNLSGGEEREKCVTEATEIIIFAGGSTIVGFSTLLVSSLPGLLRLGEYMIAGILFSIITSLFLLPSLFAMLSRSYFTGKPVRSRGLSTRGRSKMAIIPLAVFVAGSIGATRLHHDTRFTRAFHRNSDIMQTYDFFSAEHHGIDQIEIIVDTGEVGGLIDLNNFNRLISIVDKISLLDQVHSTVSIDRIIDRSLPSLMRIATGGGLPGLSAGTLVDKNLQSTKILVRIDIRADSSREYSQVFATTRERIEEVLADESGEMYWLLSGPLIKDQIDHERLVRGQLRGIVLFFGMLMLILLFAFRSIWYAILALLPSLAAGVIYFGVYGWLGYSTGITSGVSIALIVGVSVDDVLFLLLHYRRLRRSHNPVLAIQNAVGDAGAAIVETTLVINLGLAVFLGSFSAAFFYTGIATILALSSATALTLLFIPTALLYLQRKRVINR